MTTIHTAFKALSIILLTNSMTLLFLVVMSLAQNLLAGVGWHKFASVSWNG